MTDRSIFALSEPCAGAGGETGTWRTYRPQIDLAKCTGCQLCWIYCPDAAIDRTSRKIDLLYCKGCGVCAKECPAKAITMVTEGLDYEESS